MYLYCLLVGMVCDTYLKSPPHSPLPHRETWFVFLFGSASLVAGTAISSFCPQLSLVYSRTSCIFVHGCLCVCAWCVHSWPGLHSTHCLLIQRARVHTANCRGVG